MQEYLLTSHSSVSLCFPGFIIHSQLSPPHFTKYAQYHQIIKRPGKQVVSLHAQEIHDRIARCFAPTPQVPGSILMELNPRFPIQLHANDNFET
jgi:hypothetical protein